MGKTIKKTIQHPFRIIPYYTGDETLEEILKNPKSVGLLWLEILLNDEILWENYLNRPEIKSAYEKACVWYAHFKTMIEGHAGRKPLEVRMGKIDDREYRRFLEALNFVSD
jgi:hypothetical protein